MAQQVKKADSEKGSQRVLVVLCKKYYNSTILTQVVQSLLKDYVISAGLR